LRGARRPSADDKIQERALLLKRAFSKVDLYEMGRELDLPYFKGIPSGWRIEDEDEAAVVLAAALSDDSLMEILKRHRPREWAVFRGRYYVLQRGKLSLEGFGRSVEKAIRRVRSIYGQDAVSVLKTMLRRGGTASLRDLKRAVKTDNLEGIMDQLTRLNLVVLSYRGDKYREWRILDETIPLIEAELGYKAKRRRPAAPKILHAIQPLRPADKGADEGLKGRVTIDPLEDERERIRRMDLEFDGYLEDLLKHRLEETIRFGKQFGVGYLASYLKELFGEILYFDSLLSISQQYGLANVTIIHEKGKTGRKTGWSLALFGDPGTGKSFATRDMILGQGRRSRPAWEEPLLRRDDPCTFHQDRRGVRWEGLQLHRSGVQRLLQVQGHG